MSYRDTILEEREDRRERNTWGNGNRGCPEEHPFKLFTPKTGENRIRIMVDEIAEVDVHFEPHVDGSIRRFTCPGERTCLFCTAPNRSESKPLWSVPVIDRADGAIKLFDFTNWTIWRELNQLASNVGEWMEYDIVINRDGVGPDTRYDVTAASSEPLREAERALELPDIEDHLRVETYDEILKRLGVPRKQG